MGPVFFTLLRNSIEFGKKSGYAAATGIFVSDIFVVLICYLLSRKHLDTLIEHPLAYVFAAIVLLLFAGLFIFKKIKDPLENTAIVSSKTIRTAFFQGFTINFANPSVFFIWIGFLGIGQSLYPTPALLLVYSLGILVGIYSTDLLKAYFAQKIRHLLHKKVLGYIYKAIGLLLVILALRLLWLEFLA
ncbi:MAG: LysE family transporter [Bacteroidia bacterium]